MGKKDISKKDLFFLYGIYSIQSYLFYSHLVILKFKSIPSMFMYAMNIRNDVIGLMLCENCKSKQTDFIAWLSRCCDMIYVHNCKLEFINKVIMIKTKIKVHYNTCQTQRVHSICQFVFIKIPQCPSIFYLKAKMNQKQ